MNIALLGFGVVGRGVYDLLTSREDIRVKYVVCLEDISLPDAESVKDIHMIVEDPSIDTVDRPFLTQTDDITHHRRVCSRFHIIHFI